MSKPVRIGVIGCGSVSSKYLRLAGELKLKGQAEVVIGCDVNPDRRAYMAGEYGVERFTTNYEDVLRRDDVDLVLVLTSMPEHGPLAKAALEAGKHVLVEKPMTVTLDAAAELVEIAKTSRGFLIPAPHVVLSPTFQAIWRRVHNGDIGKVHLPAPSTAGPAPGGANGSTAPAAAPSLTSASITSPASPPCLAPLSA